MGYLEYIIFAVAGWFFYITISRLKRRVLFLEQKWAEQQRRRSMYQELVRPTQKALHEMGDFGIQDIEETGVAEQIKQRTKAGKSWLQWLRDKARKTGRL